MSMLTNKMNDFPRRGNKMLEPSARDVIRATEGAFNLALGQLYEHASSPAITQARDIAVYLLRRLTSLNLKEIGESLHADHSAALEAVRRVENRLHDDQNLGKIIRDIEIAIRSSMYEPTPEKLREALKFSSNHKPELERDRICGCFYCRKIFSPNEITEWLISNNPRDKRGTAVCPYCGIDALIGESSGYPITTQFLQAMHEEWF